MHKIVKAKIESYGVERENSLLLIKPRPNRNQLNTFHE